MKKIILIAAIIGGFNVMTANTANSTNLLRTEISTTSEYCEGWEDGYCEGWKDVKGQYAICPITPICPIPEIGKDDYRGGYNRGFKAGMRAARNN